MRLSFIIILLLVVPYLLKAQLITVFEQSKGRETATYQQTISFYRQLSAQYNNIQIQAAGTTDSYYPLNVVYYTNGHDFNISAWKASGKIIILINNGIHPGEPDGVDASMLLLRDAATGKIKIPDNIVLAIIPIYNIGGALNRSSYSRVNQNGPVSYGFRGNSENLDLNRDFIKMDALETRALVALFHQLDPDLFIDNHVSDGADYQHIMTLLATQHNKLGGSMGKYMNNKLVPMLYKDMEKKGYDLVPYVNDFDKTPDSGWAEFYDPPRFSSGFAAMYQTFAFVPESHMLKPYADRVKATYELMKSFITIAAKNAADIKEARVSDRQKIQQQEDFTIDWILDTSRYTAIRFKGYEVLYKTSKVSGLPRLFYDENKPYTKMVSFYNHYIAKQQVKAPHAYVIKAGWHNILERLKINDVKMDMVEHDTARDLTAYRIDHYETLPHPYESHFLHKNVRVSKHIERVNLVKGDYIIRTDQVAKRYLIETLEPTGPDGFFAWNFFDAVLQEKEYYSDYVFEDVAAHLLNENPDLQRMLDERKQADTAFAKNGAAQLDYIYHHSQYYEPEHLRYPVFRID